MTIRMWVVLLVVLAGACSSSEQTPVDSCEPNCEGERLQVGTIGNGTPFGQETGVPTGSPADAGGSESGTPAEEPAADSSVPTDTVEEENVLEPEESCAEQCGVSWVGTCSCAPLCGAAGICCDDYEEQCSGAVEPGPGDEPGGEEEGEGTQNRPVVSGSAEALRPQVVPVQKPVPPRAPAVRMRAMRVGYARPVRATSLLGGQPVV